MNIRKSIAAIATAGAIAAGGLIAAAPAQAYDQAGFYNAVAVDYRIHTGRALLYNVPTIVKVGRQCTYEIYNLRTPFDLAALRVSNAYLGANVALGRATCAQAIRFGVRY